VRSAAFGPDGKRIVTASDDNTARVWDAATGEEIAVPRGHVAVLGRMGILFSAAFSPDGKRIVRASEDKTARIWDAATAIAPGLAHGFAVLRGHDGSVNSAAFSPDGKRVVTASEDKTAGIWDAATANKITILLGHVAAVHSATFSPDGKRIVTGLHAFGTLRQVRRSQSCRDTPAPSIPPPLAATANALSLRQTTAARIWDRFNRHARR
jgi:WD40 repeat protein